MMVRSLRARLLLAMTVVLLAAAGAIALHSSLTARREFARFIVTREYPPERVPATHAIQRHYRERGSWRGVDALLRRLHDEQEVRTLVLAPDGRVIAAYPPDVANFRVRQRAGSVALERTTGTRSERLLVRGGPPVIRDAAGAVVGAVYVLPREMGDPSALFQHSFNRWLLFGVVAATVLALLITATIFRRLFAPLDAVAAGARSLARGRLDTRVTVGGDDEIADLGRAFNAMAEELERNERARRDMVSDVAHELRTPLTNIRCQLEAVQDGLAIPDAALVASLSEEVTTLGRLVDDLQQLSLAEAGQLRLDLDDVAVEELVARTVGGFRRRAEEKGLALTTSIEPGLVVRADLDRAVQIVGNFVGNALTHARSSIVIAARGEEGFVAIDVDDDGAGVPPEQLDRIFDRFVRADASRSRATGGAGLGLAIARELARLHGGSVHAENRAAGGARFTVRFPRSS